MDLQIYSSWLELEDAATYMSSRLKQEISTQHIYQLAINGKLNVAVKIISLQEALIEQICSGSSQPTPDFNDTDCYRKLSGSRWYLSKLESSIQLLEFLEKYSSKYDYAALIETPIVLESIDKKEYAHLIFTIRDGLKTRMGKQRGMPDDYILEVSRSEIDSLIEALAPKKSAIKPEVSDNETLLVLVGALSIALSELNPELKRAGKPNASKIRDYLVESVFEIDPDSQKHPRGLGSSTVSKNIKSGLNYLDKLDLSNVDVNVLFEAIKLSADEVERKKG